MIHIHHHHRRSSLKHLPFISKTPKKYMIRFELRNRALTFNFAPLMASFDTDVTMVPVGEGSGDADLSSFYCINLNLTSLKKAKWFEIKKWNAVFLCV
ncbi:cullin-RING-type E3 NEDD8 transferase [Sarracenia purpurea var. burkii]